MPQLQASDHHSHSWRVRRAADATNSSLLPDSALPKSEQNRSMAAVISSGLLSGWWRAKYSATASPNNRLSDFRVRLASRSASAYNPLGMETEVFISAELSADPHGHFTVIPSGWPHGHFNVLSETGEEFQQSSN
jgi:hypothetical protein